ncbi:MAG: citrate transporter [Lachnospiraceae bacterium]|nr:citrate transporter [Lachnospiraceae bacterium]
MKKIFVQIKNFIKKETVLVVAWFLAVLSMLIIIPNKGYIDYIDFRTLGILFCLMAVMAGLKNCGFFRMVADKLMKLAGGQRSLEMILVLLCFFFSMLITNDVALITFVPLALEVLKSAGRKDRVVPVVVMQTIAANLGSMATPVGNPQNLYLYTKSQMSVTEFLIVMLPYTLIAMVVIIAAVIICSKKGERVAVLTDVCEEDKAVNAGPGNFIKEFMYIIMFLLCLFVVLKFIPVGVMVIITIMALIITDKKVLLQIDYLLLLTFVGFFIFVGNMGQIEQFSSFLNDVLSGNEFIVSALLSQIVSNVPAAILLSGFTTQWKELLIGVNVGGLGTLIASMASLISYKFVVKDYGELKGKYMVYFTASNIIFFAIMVAAYYIMVCVFA